MIIQADARAIPLRDGCVQCVVTSPPYWGLRDYGTARWEGGDAECGHVERSMKPSTKSTLEDHGDDGRSPYLDSLRGIPYRDLCGRCGARRIDAQIGLEATPEAFVATMVEVFREVRRILKPDGTCWLNLGDSYAGARHGLYKNGLSMGTEGPMQKTNAGSIGVLSLAKDYGKPKDLIGIPWRVAFALQADGWYLRSDIIWAKPSPMPESVTDRPTRSHEYLFLLSKSERYFYDADAIREPAYNTVIANGKLGKTNNRDRNDAPSQAVSHTCFNPNAQRNKRDVWTINSEPTPEAHFATFPQKLVEPCILAGTSQKGECSQCGKNWVRVTEVSGGTIGKSWVNHTEDLQKGLTRIGLSLQNARNSDGQPYSRVSLGWQPSCSCDVPTRPNLVFDPFLGSGTVGIVAERFGRRWAGTDLSPTYLRDIAKHRTAQMGLRL